MDDKRYRQQVDPVKRQEEASAADMGGLSPMGNPEDFQPHEDIQFKDEDLHPFLLELKKEHVELSSKNEELKEAVTLMKSHHTINGEIKGLINNFLSFFHEEFVPHNKKEEIRFFPLLNKRLFESDEHSSGDNPFTGIKVLEDDHVHAIRLGAVLTNLLYLFDSITDFKSRSVLVKETEKVANELAELIELHIFREDNIALGLGQSLLTREELDLIHAES